MDYDLEVKPELLSQVKDTLRITHKQLDGNVTKIIEGGMAEIQSLTGPLTFGKKTPLSLKATSLLEQFCLYSWNDLLSEFHKDYRSNIISLQLYYVQCGGV